MSKQEQSSPAGDFAAHDRMGHALLTLAKHVWTLHDRQRVLEAQLAAAGIEIDIDTPPDASSMETLDIEREKFINDLLSSLSGDEETSS